MLNSLRRFFLFGAAGSVATSLWAVVAGTIWGTIIQLLAGRASGGFDDIEMGVGIFSLFSLPLGFVSFAVAGLVSRESGARTLFRSLVRYSYIRSLQGAMIMGSAGALMAAIIGRNTNWLNTIVLPRYLLGFAVGTFLGFLIGLVWGVIVGLTLSGKLKSKTSHPLTEDSSPPPLASPSSYQQQK